MLFQIDDISSEKVFAGAFRPPQAHGTILSDSLLLDQFTETACTAHIAVTNPMALRGLHIEAFKYAFLQLGLSMILGVVAASNAKALKLNAHFGFTEIARIKDAYAQGVDQVVLQMKREDCKYINQLKKVA